MHSLVNWSNCVKMYRNVFSAIEFLIYKHNILNLFKVLQYNHNNLLQKYWICTFSGNFYSNSIYNVDKSINNAIEIQNTCKKLNAVACVSDHIFSINFFWFLPQVCKKNCTVGTKNPHVPFKMMLMWMNNFIPKS